MESMTSDETLALLRQENPKARQDDLILYADAFLAYQEAVGNIAKNGMVVAHPRTGAPIDNPYLRIREAAGKTLARLRRVRNIERLWSDR